MRQAFFKINKVFNGLLRILLFLPSKTPFIVRIMNNPLISVIVPIYGIERYVGHCIESLMRQTYQNLEIILVDDGSPDRCPQICDLYASKDKRIKVIHKENGGIVTARKAGVKIAQGEYIGFVDGDDWVGEGYFQSMLNTIMGCDADIAVAGCSRDLYRKSMYLHNALPSGVYEGESMEFLRKNMMSFGSFFRFGVTTYHWNKLFRREAIIPFQMLVEDGFSVMEDGAAVYPAMLAAKKIVLFDNFAYHYRQRSDSMLKSMTTLSVEAERLKRVYYYLQNAVKDYPAEYQLRKQVEDAMLAVYIVRCGGITSIANDKVLNSIYNRSIEGKKVVIGGAGTFGQQMYRRLMATDKVEITGWIDPFYWEYRRIGLNVDPVESITNADYDYVLMAGLDSSFKEMVIRTLADYGVAPDNVLPVEMNYEIRHEILMDYLKCEGENV